MFFSYNLAALTRYFVNESDDLGALLLVQTVKFQKHVGFFIID